MKKQLLTLTFSIVLFNAFSQWNTNTSINTPVSIEAKSQANIHMVGDTKRGVILTWDDNRNSLTTNTDIYAQRIKNTGLEKWATNGIVICNSIGVQKSNAITESDNGSAIITWEDDRSGNFDIYAQKVDSSGNILWTPNGVLICSKTTNQKNPKIVSDNVGGAIIVWEDSVSFYWDVYAQRINSVGVTQWGSTGVPICAAPNLQLNPKIDIDGVGGAIITWQDKRSNIDYDIYAQRINSAGAIQWTPNGLIICNAVNVQNNPRIEPDGASGAYITWVDRRGGINYDIYAQRVSASGVNQWATNGLAVCSATNNQSAQDMKYLGANGILVSWKDERVGTNAIYAQIVNSSGTPQLTSDGVLLSNGLKCINPNTVVDGTGGGIIVWQDSTTIGWDIKAQKINASNAIAWTSGGITICNAVDDQINPTLVNDGNGGAIFAWEDRRNASNYDIYAHRVLSDGPINVLENSNNTISLITAPNPIYTTGKITLSESKSDWELQILDVMGRQVKKEQIKAGTSFEINSNDYQGGLYFYYIQLKNDLKTAKGNFTIIK